MTKKNCFPKTANTFYLIAKRTEQPSRTLGSPVVLEPRTPAGLWPLL